MCQLKVKLDIGATLPTRAHPTDAGLDLYAAEDCVIPRDGKALVSTGVHAEIPKGCFGLVSLRSGFAAKNNVILVNAPGIIDSSYRGEIKLALKNLDWRGGQRPATRINAGDRIAQLVIVPCLFPVPVEVDLLDETERGEGGFGSTGK